MRLTLYCLHQQYFDLSFVKWISVPCKKQVIWWRQEPVMWPRDYEAKCHVAKKGREINSTCWLSLLYISSSYMRKPHLRMIKLTQGSHMLRMENNKKGEQVPSSCAPVPNIKLQINQVTFQTTEKLNAVFKQVLWCSIHKRYAQHF